MSSKLTFLKLINDYNIVIPLIQRDYAQGRIKEKSKAENFLLAIQKGLKSNLNLDFIYGRIDSKNFIPLDGQQRLTTIFLIHWYMSLGDMYVEELNKFSYEVRSSTKDFINVLTKKENWEKFSKSNIKYQIENSSWFFLSWKDDPTVVSILNMIELIEQYFSDSSIAELDNITFEVLYLDEFSLTDELYVKMNARGKPLTNFENFKAEFDNYIDETYAQDSGQRENYKANLDNDWLNIFWNLAKEEDKENIENAPKLADQKFYNFFYNMTFNFYLEQKDKLLCKGKEYKIISDKREQKGFVQSCTIFDFYKDVYENTIKVKETIKILENLKAVDDDFKVFVKDIVDISQWERARFYSICLGYINELDEIEFDRWKRVSFNLINNQRIESPDDIIRTIKSLKLLIDSSNKNIYDYIKDKPDNIKYFAEIQRKEESLKAELIINDPKWEEELLKAEKDWYLEGQIGFLLDFSKNDMDKFKIYRDKFIALWEFTKNNENNQILIYQALLSIGNYLPRIGSNYTFCSYNVALRTKIDNWRKVFNGDNKEFFKKLLDSINVKNIDESLIKTIDSFMDKEDWKYYFIKAKDALEKCGNEKTIRFYNENDILLLPKGQTNAYHYEYYSFALFAHLEQLGINCGEYQDRRSQEEPKYFEVNEKYIIWDKTNGGFIYENIFDDNDDLIEISDFPHHSFDKLCEILIEKE